MEVFFFHYLELDDNDVISFHVYVLEAATHLSVLIPSSSAIPNV